MEEKGELGRRWGEEEGEVVERARGEGGWGSGVEAVGERKRWRGGRSFSKGLGWVRVLGKRGLGREKEKERKGNEREGNKTLSKEEKTPRSGLKELILP